MIFHLPGGKSLVSHRSLHRLSPLQAFAGFTWGVRAGVHTIRGCVRLPSSNYSSKTPPVMSGRTLAGERLRRGSRPATEALPVLAVPGDTPDLERGQPPIRQIKAQKSVPPFPSSSTLVTNSFIQNLTRGFPLYLRSVSFMCTVRDLKQTIVVERH